MAIKNIVFDVGNVLVRWDPQGILRATFPEHENIPDLTQQIFKHATWMELNLGRITQDEAIAEYQQRLKIELDKLMAMMETAKKSLTPIAGMNDLMKLVHQADYQLYALTDNTHAFIAHLKQAYDFWLMFKGVVVSAEVNYLKPSPEIYQCLLTTYQLSPSETVFIDDVKANVDGARALGIHAIQFENAEQCYQALKDLNVKF